MDYGYVSVPAAVIRRKPRHNAEMVSQFLFGEPVKVLKTKGKSWVKVRSLTDMYEGWATGNLFQEADEFQVKKPISYTSTALISEITFNGSRMLIPFGSSLPELDQHTGMLGGTVFQVDGSTVNRRNPVDFGERLQEVASQWVNVPYQWGGKTLMGVDCSGFVQLVFKVLGIDLPRDAWQQAQEGALVGKLKDAQPGDLVFFDDKEEIVHVGILLGENRVVHASGTVRIDQIDKKGITHAVNGKRTHSLRVIRRHR